MAAPRRLLLPLGIALAALALWDTFLVYPFRLFVVFLHEISHGLAAVFTGGAARHHERQRLARRGGPAPQRDGRGVRRCLSGRAVRQ